MINQMLDRAAARFHVARESLDNLPKKQKLLMLIEVADYEELENIAKAARFVTDADEETMAQIQRGAITLQDI